MFLINSLFTQVLICIFSLLTVLYFYFTKKFRYWKSRNVPYLKPIPFFGNALEVFTFRKTIGDLTKQIYETRTEPFVGFFVCDQPCLVFRDLELIKKVLIKDFDVFSNRSIFDDKAIDPLGSHLLFLMKTPDWREMRRKITPVFTTGKMKNMFQLIDEASNGLLKYLNEQVKRNNLIMDIREASAKYTTDAISSAAFGINANCFKNENSEFLAVTKRFFNWNILERAIAMSAYFIAPNLVKLFKLQFVDVATAKFLRTAFWRTMHEREELKFVRNDLLDILIEMKKKHLFNDDNDKIVAQAVQFFVAGFETTSSTISFALYELACNKDIQTKLRNEINEALNKNDNLFSYDSVKNIEYLDMCINETLRKYPVLPFLDRKCNIDYQIPGTDIVLEKETPIFIPAWGLHYDSKYFPNPDEFDPTRFSEENVKTIPPFAYLPFGEGPRNCIGARFGLVSSKLGVAKILSEFEVDVCDQTQYPLKLITKGILLAPNTELLLKFTRI